MSVSDTKVVLIGGNEVSDINQWSTSVVVVPWAPSEVPENEYGHRFGL